MDRARSLVAVLAGLSLAVGAVQADAASVSSEAIGTVWGTNAGDADSGGGLVPVASSAAYTRPNPPGDGALSSAASAGVGQLAARASVTVSNAPGYLAPTFSLYGTSTAQGLASFVDRWTFMDRPLDTPGALRLGLRFDGAGAGTASGATAVTDARFQMDLTSLTGGGSPYDFANYSSGFIPLAAEQVIVELDFLYGRPINVGGSLLARAWIVSLIDSTSYSGSGDSIFDQTAAFETLEVQNDQGQWTTSYTLATESGGQYPFQVPEPAPVASAVAAIAVLASVRARRAIWCQPSPSRTS